MKNDILVIIAIIFILSCTTKKSEMVNLLELRKYPIFQRQTEVTLINSFIINKECNKSQKEKYADVFLVKVKNTKDTVLVFSVCKKTFPFLKKEYKGPQWLVIDSVNVAKSYPTMVITSVDKSIITRKYNFIVTEIYNLED